MTNFHVWAPAAQTVEVALDPGPNLSAPRVKTLRLALRKEQRGWWRLSGQNLPANVDYAYSLDGGRLVPDPRSPWQPSGIAGPSRTLDHTEFRWSDHRWQAPPLSSAILYELHVGTFTPQGTFESAIEKLPHLLRLGVTHVELMPVAEFPGEHGWGYDGVDLFAPHHAYGGPEGLKRFVDACHSDGLAVLLDVVYNHLGPDGNYLGHFGPYFTDRYRTPWGEAVNLDGPGSSEVRRFFCDNARMWLRDYHLDGLRLDAVHAMFDSSAVHFLEQLALETEGLQSETGRHFSLIAENDLNDPRIVTPRHARGYGLTAQWNDDFHHALHTVLTGDRLGYYSDFGKLGDLAKALKRVYVYDGCDSAHRQRTHGRAVGDLSAHCFVGYLQNHDQVGNRARGDRITRLLNPRQLKIGAALVMCAPFVPMLFQGEEFGASTPFLYFTDHRDPKLAAAVSNGRRAEFASFGWKPDEIPDPQERTSFGCSKLDWHQTHQEVHESLLCWHHKLISLRRNTPALRDGRLDRVHVEFDERASWLALYRHSVGVVCNFSDRRLSVPLKFTGRASLASDPDFTISGNTLEIAAESVVIIENEAAQ